MMLIDDDDRLNNSQLYHQAKTDFKSRGIDADVKLNLPAMMAAKTNSVKSLTGGIETYLFKKNGVDYIKGSASFASPTQINVALNEGGETQVEGKNVIIATGSEVTPFPGIEIDEKRIVSSTGVLDLKEVPKKVGRLGFCGLKECADCGDLDGGYWRRYHRTRAGIGVVSTRSRGHGCRIPRSGWSGYGRGVWVSWVLGIVRYYRLADGTKESSSRRFSQSRV